MAETIIKAQVRDEFGKGAARRLRRDKLIPVVMHGHAAEPTHLALPAHATSLALRTANALLNIEMEGHAPQLALAREVQRHPVSDAIQHVDLIAVKRGEKVQVEVPLTVTGEFKGEGVVILDQNSILLEVEATNIPAFIEVDIEGREVGFVVAASDLVLPQGAVFHGEPDDLILSIQAPQARDMGESAEEGAGEEAEAGPEA
jgi:large subunit ribosomal protein L25